jgi:hypothetical protein
MTGGHLNRRGRAPLWFIVVPFAVFAAALLVPGIYLLVQSTTGTPAQASVDSCETTGAGRWQRTECSGSWIVGGSLLDNGHVIVGTIQGADESDAGKTIDVMLHGDDAYSRRLTTALVLIGFGVVPAVAAALVTVGLIRLPNAGRRA